ncbi:MAG: hypothetical protein DHS20C12_14620 [Pseudohongiella sp.]|nr:MAG: hypothetical protein DHS20C12_14620 [Pseudohongiella sp.]
MLSSAAIAEEAGSRTVASASNRLARKVGKLEIVCLWYLKKLLDVSADVYAHIFRTLYDKAQRYRGKN